MSVLGDLCRTLVEIAATDPSAEGHTGPDTPEVSTRYARRNDLVWQALRQAVAAGVPAGVGYDFNDPHPVVVYIDLPTVGQVSWHLPALADDIPPLPDRQWQWDGHTTWEKYARIDMLTGAHGVFATCDVWDCSRCGEVAGYMESQWRKAVEAKGIHLRDVVTLTPAERARHNEEEQYAVMADEHAAAADADTD